MSSRLATMAPSSSSSSSSSLSSSAKPQKARSLVSIAREESGGGGESRLAKAATVDLGAGGNRAANKKPGSALTRIASSVHAEEDSGGAKASPLSNIAKQVHAEDNNSAASPLAKVAAEVHREDAADDDYGNHDGDRRPRRKKKAGGRSSRRRYEDTTTTDSENREPSRGHYSSSSSSSHHRRPRAEASDEKRLGRAAMRGDTSAVRRLLNDGVAPDATDAEHSNPWTPIMWASAKGHPDVVRLLLDAGADVHMTEALSGWGCLHLAAINASSKRHLRVIEHLLAAGADKALQDKYGDLPLHCCRLGDTSKKAQRRVTEEARTLLGGLPPSRDDPDVSAVLDVLERSQQAALDDLDGQEEGKHGGARGGGEEGEKTASGDDEQPVTRASAAATAKLAAVAGGGGGGGPSGADGPPTTKSAAATKKLASLAGSGGDYDLDEDDFEDDAEDDDDDDDTAAAAGGGGIPGNSRIRRAPSGADGPPTTKSATATSKLAGLASSMED